MVKTSTTERKPGHFLRCACGLRQNSVGGGQRRRCAGAVCDPPSLVTWSLLSANLAPPTLLCHTAFSPLLQEKAAMPSALHVVAIMGRPGPLSFRSVELIYRHGPFAILTAEAGAAMPRGPH